MQQTGPRRGIRQPGPARAPWRTAFGRRVGPIVALAALIALAWRDVLFLGRTLVERDALRLARPSREFLVHALRSGRLPEWFDGVNFGAPFAGNPVHEVLAPLGWLMALMPVPWGFDAYGVLHVLIGALGVAALSRRLGAAPLHAAVAGATLALGGYVTAMVPNGLATATAWIPWVAWAADRLAVADASSRPRAAVVFAAVFSLQVVTGEPASLAIALLVSLAVVAGRSVRPWRLAVPWLASLLGAGLLAAVAILPGLAVLEGSARGAGLDGGGLEWSLHPARLVETVWPMAFGTPDGDGWYAGLLLREGPGDPCWSSSLFVGLPILLAACAAWRERAVRRLLGASVLFLVLAAGPLTPLYPALLRALPPLGLVNFPEKFVYGALLLWVAAAGVGLGRLAGGEASRRFRVAAVGGAALLGICALAATLGRGSFETLLERRAADWHVLIRIDAGLAAALRGAWVATIASALFAWAIGPGRRRPHLSSAALLLALLGPVVWNANGITPLASRATVAGMPELLRPLATRVADREAPRPRLFRLDPRREGGPFADGEATARYYHETLDTNIASRFGVQVAPGFLPGESVLSRRFGREVFPGMDKLAFVRLFGVEWLAAQDADKLGMPFETATHGPEGWSLLSTGRVRPRGFVTSRWKAAASPEEALAGWLDREHDDDPALVRLVGADSRSTPLAGALWPCRVRMPRPERVEMDCASPHGGYAVLLDEWARGWTATVDGRATPILSAEGLFRAVRVEAGERRVVMRYRTPRLRTAATISLVAWIAWGVALAFTYRRRDRAVATSAPAPSCPRGAG